MVNPNLDPEALYLQLGRLIASMPELTKRGSVAPETNQWFGRAVALLEASGDTFGASQVASCARSLGTTFLNVHAQTVASVLHTALARAEMNAPASTQGAFIAAGDTYNAFAAVGKVLARATSSILLVDAYADPTVITDFAIQAREGISVRILGADKEARKQALRPAVERWAAQFGQSRPLAVRTVPAADLHDRLILIDRSEAWNTGQSFNGLAQRSHTSIEKSDPELAAMKIYAYEALWDRATPL